MNLVVCCLRAFQVGAFYVAWEFLFCAFFKCTTAADGNIFVLLMLLRNHLCVAATLRRKKFGDHFDAVSRDLSLLVLISSRAPVRYLVRHI